MRSTAHYENAVSWRKEIVRASRSTGVYLKGLTALVVIVFLVVSALVALLAVSDGETANLPFALSIPQSAVNYMSAIAAALGVFFSIGILGPVSRWYQPERRRYRPAAVEIIESLRRANVLDATKELAMKNVAQRLLGAVEGDDPAVDPEEMLLRASCLLAKEIRNLQTDA